MMHILLVTLGTAGDVHPFLALGCELKRRNHRVTLISNDYFRPLAERLGLDFEGFGSIDHYRAVLSNPDIWHPIRGFQILVQELFLGSMRPAFEAIGRLRGERTVLVAPCFMFGARIAAEKFSIPLATVVLQPASVWSTSHPTALCSLSWSRYLPLGLQSLLASGLAKFFLEPRLGPETNRFRRELGLSRACNIATQWLYSPDCVIALFPDWFAPIVPDWPPQLIQTGFVSHEPFDTISLPRECEEFLADGEPPIVFTPGSGHCQASQFFEVAAAVCEQLDHRGLFLTGFSGNLPQVLSKRIRHFAYVPFSRVFPLCKAIVHHGGIGTLAKGLASGVPQLIMPMAYDQPDNARRLQKIGIGDLIRPKAFRPAPVAEKLGRLLDSHSVGAQCRMIAARIDTGAALTETCSVIESMSGF